MSVLTSYYSNICLIFGEMLKCRVNCCLEELKCIKTLAFSHDSSQRFDSGNIAISLQQQN